MAQNYTDKLLSDITNSSAAYKEGRDARLRGAPVLSNPYDLWVDTFLHQVWTNGWSYTDHALRTGEEPTCRNAIDFNK